ncbi:MAG: hypothetical protein EOO04_40015 [Chitinophagaceae bacterium]|nr:MAG: hypothetical protein EOO04_40015 [Chitinophagaceae bacterium]
MPGQTRRNTGANFLRGTLVPSLKAYDSEGYKLLDSIYSGILQSRLQLKRESVAVAQGAISGISTERSELVLINNKAKPVKLFWIDQSGNAKLYATIPAGKRHVQPTFVSHVWMIEDADRGPLGYIRVNDPPCEIKLTD